MFGSIFFAVLCIDFINLLFFLSYGVEKWLRGLLL